MGLLRLSTNIERDFNTEIDYVVTKNSNAVFNNIQFNFQKGQGAFTVIGSYGTGKSTFLWAFEQHLLGEKKFQEEGKQTKRKINKYNFVRIVGDNSSFKKRFCEVLELEWGDDKSVIIAAGNKLKELYSKTTCTVFFVDEFGKFLEYTAKHAPEEMYFVQLLAEYCNSFARDILFITTLHQNLSAYAKGLTSAQKSEWDKVSGRVLSIGFDEPVDQLLFFAAERLKYNEVSENLHLCNNSGLESLIASKLVNVSEGSQVNFDHLLPLDPLASTILTKSIQRYGQNERSLFSFLESEELKSTIEKEIFFTVADSFDYLISNMNAAIEDGEKNPYKPQWKSAILALEKAEFFDEFVTDDIHKVLKTICLANIFSHAGAVLNKNSLSSYGELYLNIKNCSEIVELLEKRKLIKFSNHRSKYNFVDGTDIDIEHELINASDKIEHDINLVNRLKSHFYFGIEQAKRNQYEVGTPRLFEYRFFDQIDTEDISGEIDGAINLIFSKKNINTTLLNQSSSYSNNNIFVLFKEVDDINNTIVSIDKIDYVASQIENDHVALRLLNEEKQYQLSQLDLFVHKALFDKNSRVTWVWDGNKVNVSSRKDLNRLLSDVCSKAFPKTPKYLNEMVNKEFLSPPILTARKALLRQMLEFGDFPNLNFDQNRFPAEKTIYLSLLKNTGIHRDENGDYGYHAPTDESFLPLWEDSSELLQNSSVIKMPIIDFYETFSKGEYKLKRGFLDYWIPLFLLIKKEDYALYDGEGNYIPYMSFEVLDLIYRRPDKFYIKALSTAGVSGQYLNLYKDLVGFNESKVKGTEGTLISVYSNFVKFFSSLPEFSRKTKNISPSAIKFREVIEGAKDPESALFSQIPLALGFQGVPTEKDLARFIEEIKSTIRIYREAYDLLIERIEAKVTKSLKIKSSDFKEVKAAILEMFSSIDVTTIGDQKVQLLLRRLLSGLDDRHSYWESVCDAVLSKKLNKLSDEEVNLFEEKLLSQLKVIQRLISIHDVTLSKGQEAFEVSLLNSSLETNLSNTVIVDGAFIAKNKPLINKLKKELKFDKVSNRALLITLLKEQLGNE